MFGHVSIFFFFFWGVFTDRLHYLCFFPPYFRDAIFQEDLKVVMKPPYTQLAINLRYLWNCISIFAVPYRVIVWWFWVTHIVNLIKIVNRPYSNDMGFEDLNVSALLLVRSSTVVRLLPFQCILHFLVLILALEISDAYLGILISVLSYK